MEITQLARRRALVHVLIIMNPTLAQLDELIGGRYGDELETITLEELHAAAAQPPADRSRALTLGIFGLAKGQPVRDQLLKIAEAHRGTWLASGYFKKITGAERWTVQNTLRDLADEGKLDRKGKTAGTRYRCA